ncbi:MAG TPA: SPFH domain-containing protein, partial [Candidatus Nanoarchaeia archaeon]
MTFIFPALQWICWIGAILVFPGTVAAYYLFEYEREKAKPWLTRMLYLSLGLAAAGFFFGSIVVVPAGHQGMPLRLGAPQDRVLGMGPGWRIPVLERVQLYDTRVQKVPYEDLDTASAEYQSVKVTGVLNYRINPEAIPWLVRNVGTLGQLEDKTLIPALHNNLKALMPSYEILAVLGNRNRIGQQVTDLMDRTFDQYRTDEGLRVVFFTAEVEEEKIPEECTLDPFVPAIEFIPEELGDIGLEAGSEPEVEGEPQTSPTPVPDEDGETGTAPSDIVVDESRCIQSVFLQNIDFSPDFNDAIEDKQVALQEAQRELFVLSRRQIEADQLEATADGEKRATIKRAEGIAAANTQIANSLSGPLGERALLFQWMQTLGPTIRTMLLPVGEGIIIDPSQLIGEVPSEDATGGQLGPFQLPEATIPTPTPSPTPEPVAEETG